MQQAAHPPRSDCATMRCASLAGLEGLLARRGTSLAPVCAAVGVDPLLLKRPEARLPVRQFVALLEEAARASGDDAIGLKLGLSQGLDSFGPLSDAALQSPDLASAVANVSRYFFVHQEGAQLELRLDGRHAVIAYSICDAEILDYRQDAELSLAKMLNFARALTGSRGWTPVAVYFEHPEPRDASEHRRIFGAPVYFSQPCNALVAPRELLGLRSGSLMQPDPRRLQRLDQLAQARAAQAAPGDGLLVSHADGPAVAGVSAASGPVVLITGASSGLGRACAEHLAARGCRVYGTSRRGGAPESQAGGWQLLGMDVTSEESVAQSLRMLLLHEGRIDVVVNNAGDGVAGAIEDTSLDEARRQLDTNFFGVLRVCRAVLPAMRARGGGLIINVSSLGGLVGLPFQGLYSASKFAVEGMSEALRMEVQPFGVRVVLVEPGDFRTGFTAQRRRASAADGASPYAPRFDKALARMERDEHGGRDPLLMARLVERIIGMRRPKPRYQAGAFVQRFSVLFLRRLMPQKLFEHLLMASYDIA